MHGLIVVNDDMLPATCPTQNGENELAAILLDLVRPPLIDSSLIVRIAVLLV